MKLRTSDDAYETAARYMNKGRGKTVTIPRELFVNLVLDHSALSGFVTKWGERIEYSDD